MNKYMQIAIDEARIGIAHNEGGPFGAVVVKDDKIVGTGHNQVVLNNDPTCHGEMQAIRDACKNLGSFDLSGCILYTTGEPCPMCLSACLWANIDKVYYGCGIEQNEKIGFRDKKFDDLLGGRDKLKDYLEKIDGDVCASLFDEYSALKDKTQY
ncbi:MAG: nucleoside deaminase [Clostridia bacterium]|nr:nucleoside deaminase [Clostridia bacterium]